VREHDGFYLRLGVGAGGGSFAGTINSPGTALTDGAGVDGKGVTIPVELAIGGTIAPGLVIGGGSFGALMPAPSARMKNYGREMESSAGTMILSSIGPFVDYYFAPNQGFHAQAGIAFAVVAASKSPDDGALMRQNYSGTGWSTMLGVGYDTWVSEQWSCGVLGRIQYGAASLDADQGTSGADLRFLFPTLLATFTYH
jgi:hypothetical protein